MSLGKGSPAYHIKVTSAGSCSLLGDGEGLPTHGGALSHIPQGILWRRREGLRSGSAFRTLPAPTSYSPSPTWERSSTRRFLPVPGALSATPHPGLRTPQGRFARPLRRSSRALCWSIPGSAPVDLNTCPIPPPIHLAVAAQPTPRLRPHDTQFWRPPCP